MDTLDQKAGSMPPIQVFFSYAHADEKLKIELEKHLSLLIEEGYVSGWSDRAIQAGMEWEHEIDRHLSTAQIILLLISPDFMASKYCYSVEMKKAMERHEADEARVIPIILRPTDWDEAQFSKLQVLPTKAKPVTNWRNRDNAFLDVVQGIRDVVQGLRPQPSHITFNELPNLKEDWEIPTPGQFYGREKELRGLKQSIEAEQCHMMAVLGIGGIGKTSLIVTLKEQIKENFAYVFGRSLQNTPNLQSILQE